jgi:DNA-binding MarR family transcriptional regulator
MKNPAKLGARRKKINAILDQVELFSRYFDGTQNMVQTMFGRDDIRAFLPVEIKDIPATLTEWHLLQKINDSGPLNGTQLAKSMGMTRGGISKLTAKLLKKNLLARETLPDNRKEVYYTLTKNGKAVADIHEVLHEKVRQWLTAAFTEYETAELDIIGNIFTKMLNFLKRLPAL